MLVVFVILFTMLNCLIQTLRILHLDIVMEEHMVIFTQII